QVSTRSRDVKDGKLDQITREPEQVKAFRDTWADGIHSYLTYLRDRLTVMRDLLTESGSIFVQIGDENVHRVRALMDEVFGEENFSSLITVRKTGGLGSTGLTGISDFVLWYAKSLEKLKFRNLFQAKAEIGTHSQYGYALLPSGGSLALKKVQGKHTDFRVFQPTSLHTMFAGVQSCLYSTFDFNGKKFQLPANRQWSTTLPNMMRIGKAGRIYAGGNTPRFIRFLDDHPVTELTNLWTDVMGARDVVYVVQTNPRIVQRCILMTTDPGDLMLDPTCGSGTTAYVAEQWGRRWITIDTSRVALALARARLMGTRYPYYHLADSPDGREKEQEVSGRIQPDGPTHGDIRQGFVYERAPHITLKSIANNLEIDVIWETWQETLEPLRDALNEELGEEWEEWEIPREIDEAWSPKAKDIHADWWEARIKRQEEIDASIAQKADVEYLYDRPYVDNTKVRVAGPFTVESLSPHRTLPADSDELIELSDTAGGTRSRQDLPLNDFTQMVIDNLLTAGVQQSAKEDRIAFTAITGWPGEYVAAEGTYLDGSTEKRAAIFIGPEFGTVTRADLTAAASEALNARFDTLIACGFNFDAHTSELGKLGPLPILKAKMNPDLHMSEELKNTGSGNLFIVFGEPDIEWETDEDGKIVVTVLGVDVFDTKSGDVRSSGTDEIAAWFIDTDYNEESFFVRHAYFLGAQDPYKSLKTSLKVEIDAAAWETLYRDTSRPFDKPSTGRFAVKVINHFGDEVMKVFGV
ncbi:MAG: site-specific DNA-methyltransferase, partial [Rhodospirillaceae bacterium]|nr:site-specific DNA-methyltransferase [Rhodospirillaceae bacterium]